MMKKADITALMKGLQKKAREDIVIAEAFDNIDEISKTLDEIKDEEPRLRLPYVNATPIGSSAWK